MQLELCENLKLMRSKTKINEVQKKMPKTYMYMLLDLYKMKAVDALTMYVPCSKNLKYSFLHTLGAICNIM